MDLNALRDKVKAFFDLSPFLIPQAEAETAIREGVSFRGMNSLILVVAIFIASLGLNTNSTAVIIGAMLISPLMGPIIGIGLAVGVHDFELMKRSFRNLMIAASISVLTSCFYFMISPVNESHSELLARTTPTIYDVFIGFFGGAAGILALGAKNKGNVIPGVAIATALMPPLCTAGYGLATLQPHYLFGALYLFFINSVFIAVATYAGIKLMGYKLKAFADPARARKVRRSVYIIAALTMLPAIFLTYTMFVQNNFEQNCSHFVAEQFNFPNTQVLNYKTDISKQGNTLTIALMGTPLPEDSLLSAMTDKLPRYHLAGTTLRIIQGSTIQNIDVEKTSGAMLSSMYALTQQTIERQQSVIDSLRTRMAMIAANDSVGATMAPELKVVFPKVRDIAVTTAVVCSVDSARLDTLNLALVRYSAPMTAAETVKFRKYLEARLARSPIRLVPL
ncbi:MAG: DUF389 domain-containing protein [Muribaculaceae bacterium]|nr:DUF389 domain-containing protein [Muribaculaceae bacterium]